MLKVKPCACLVFQNVIGYSVHFKVADNFRLSKYLIKGPFK
jgi:hypothetical protein